MFVVSVIPLARVTTLETLSYYASMEYPVGTIIEVPVRNRQVPAMVITTEPVSAAKTALKAATFSLRKLGSQTKATSLPPSIIETARRLEREVPASMGSIIFSLLPPDIRTGARPYPTTKDYLNEDDGTPALLTDNQQARFMAYRSAIRQAFAHRGSVLFVVPTSRAVFGATELLKSGIEKRIITFSSLHTKKQIDAAYEGFTDNTSAKLIITTPNFAFLDRHDITTIIVEEAASAHYKSRTRPYLDARDMLRTYAAVTKRTCIFGDLFPRTEEEALRRDERYQTFGEHVSRHNFSSTVTIATHTPSLEKVLPIFTDELREAVVRTASTKGHTLLLSARRGIAPLVLCGDCGHVFRCPDSGAPYSLFATHKGDREERWFYSVTSGKRVRAADTCPECGSWRLREQGIGIQQVHKEAQRVFPGLTITLFDHTTATTDQKARKLISQWRESKGGILLATNMVLPYLTETHTLTGIISYEAMRAVPTWRAEEATLHTLLTLRERTLHTLCIQTRSLANDPLLARATRGLIDEFYDEEIAMRKALSYPPYATFVLLTWQGTPEHIRTLEELITTSLARYEPGCYSAPVPSTKLTRHALLRIPHAAWPDAKLMDLLRALPPSVRIEVSPDRII